MAFTVIGLVGGMTRQAGAISGVIIPATTAQDLMRASPGGAAAAAATAGQPQLLEAAIVGALGGACWARP